MAPRGSEHREHGHSELVALQPRSGQSKSFVAQMVGRLSEQQRKDIVVLSTKSIMKVAGCTRAQRSAFAHCELTRWVERWADLPDTLKGARLDFVARPPLELIASARSTAAYE